LRFGGILAKLRAQIVAARQDTREEEVRANGARHRQRGSAAAIKKKQKKFLRKKKAKAKASPQVHALARWRVGAFAAAQHSTAASEISRYG
jgi:hypothetical protein